MLTAEGDEAFVSGFEQHGAYGKSESPQKATEGYCRTLEYTIGNHANQQITQEKTGNDDAAALAAMRVDNAVREALDATRERAAKPTAEVAP